MSARDPVRELLAARGCPDDDVAGGLEGLVAAWEETAEQLEHGYPLGLDDYLSELDGRQLIEDALEVATPSQRETLAEPIRRADERVRENVREVGECLWGHRVAESEGWTPDEQWWYFVVPIAPGPLLLADLEGREQI